MAFLARQLALRCTDIPAIGSPTIILIVDREELQKQGSKLFTKSKEFLDKVVDFIFAPFRNSATEKMTKLVLSMTVRILYVFLMKLTEHSLSVQRRFSSAKMLTKI